MFDPESSFVFVIDTDSYSGNFERPMCAYLTGHVGECGVGEECKDRFDLECGAEFENVEHQRDEYGCSRPVTIYPTPGWGNDGNGKNYKVTDKRPALYPVYQSVAILFSERPTDEQIQLMKERAAKFVTIKLSTWDDFRSIKILGFRLIERVVKTTEIPV